jgi:hypothetical protein
MTRRETSINNGIDHILDNLANLKGTYPESPSFSATAYIMLAEGFFNHGNNLDNTRNAIQAFQSEPDVITVQIGDSTYDAKSFNIIGNDVRKVYDDIDGFLMELAIATINESVERCLAFKGTMLHQSDSFTHRDS